MTSYAIREYLPADEPSWLRCRVLSFLDTPYFDDVRQSKPLIAEPGFSLVAVEDDGSGADTAGTNITGSTVVGVMDVAVEGELATIDTVAVHPDHQHVGIGRALLAEARARVVALGIPLLDAWTRDQPDTLRWYRAMGFAESGHFLHVYANYYTDTAEPERAIDKPRPGLTPMMLFLDAKLEEEQAMREQFTRVHVCRRFSMEP